jgi:ACS family hexuronate transporter-like MFS transporter
MTLVSLISYVDRNTLALLAPTILRETGLTAEQYGWIISAFSVTYMIGNPVWGRLLDTFGLPRGMAAAVGFWTLASVAHAFAGGFRSFAIARAALGFGEGATFPGGLRTVVQTLPAEWRSRGIAVAYSGGSLGAIITPIIVTPVAAAFGWRGAFWFTGLVGALWLAWWAYVSRREEIRRPPKDEPLVQGAHPSLLDRNLWAFMAAYALGSLPLAFVLYHSSLYLSQVFSMNQIAIGKLLWIPPLGWEVGYFFWGWQADRHGLRDATSLTAFRRLFLLLAVLSTPLAFAASLRSVPALMTLLFFTMFVAAGFIIGSVAFATSAFSSRHAGFLAGVGAGAWSAAVAVAMPWFGRFLDMRLYATAFEVAAVIPLMGFLLWRILARPLAARIEIG